jgi:tetratricopeptide (TPR) repeat protein
MQQSNNILDKWAKRALFLRRLRLAVLFGFVIIGVGVFFYSFWLSMRPDVFEFPSYNDLDSSSETYWSDRIERDVSYVNVMNISEQRKSARLRVLVRRQLDIASELESYYDRNYAILGIARTLTKYDLDMNLDKTLRLLNETYESYSIRARIYISIALMHVRQKNFNGAMSAYYEYKQLVNHADLKLDSLENEESFMGAVTVLYLAQNIEELSDLFRVQIEFSRRINTSRRMRAYRIIAVEQARAGSFLQNSFNALRMIDDPIETSRAVQLIISYVARPPKTEPVEPTFPTPRSDGPWEAIRNTFIVRNTIDSILRIIMKETPSIEQQQTILKRIAGSILMCDPDVYKIFRASIKEMQGLDESVRIAVLKLLDNPASDKIRMELKMPPRPKKRIKNNGEGIHEIDPAKHDWIEDKDALDIQMTTIDADTLQSIDIRQYSRIFSISAASYLSTNQAEDAVKTLRKAYEITKKQPDQAEQTRALITIAELQFDAGAIDDAVKILNILNEKIVNIIKRKGNQAERSAELSTELSAEGFTDDQILKLVELQVVGRFFDDAIKTVRSIQADSLRDSGLLLIARELLRTNQLEGVLEIIDQISYEPIRSEYRYRFEVSQIELKAPIQSAVSITLPERSLLELGIDDPMLLTGDENISRGVRQLIRFGFFESAAIASKRVVDIRLRSRLLVQVGREYVLIYSSYSRRGGRNEIVGEWAFKNALIISEIIPDIEERVIFNLSIINAAILNKRHDKDSAEILKRLFDVTFQDIERIERIENPQSDDVKTLEVVEANDKENAGETGVEGKVNDDRVIESSNTSRKFRGEIFSMFLMSRVNFEMLRLEVENKDGHKNSKENNRNDNVSGAWSVELLNLFDRVMRELRGERLTLSKGRGLVNVSLLYLRLGKTDESLEAARLAESVSSGLFDKDGVIFILTELFPVYVLLKEVELYERIRDRAIGLGVSFIPMGVDVRLVNVLWRMRDIELDRVMRKLVELGKFDDVVLSVDNIHEPIIYDRVLRIIIYICVDRGEFESAEILSKKLRLPEYRFSALRDVRLIKNLTISRATENKTKVKNDVKNEIVGK